MRFFTNTVSPRRTIPAYNRTNSESGFRLNYSNIIATIAIVLSMGSIYLQFFYENFALSVNVIEEHVSGDSVTLDLIYSNQGNKDATILYSKFILYREGRKISLEIPLENQSKKTAYILTAGKQTFESMKSAINYDAIKSYHKNSVKADTFALVLNTRFLNQNTMQAEIKRGIRWMIFGEDGTISYKIDYQKIPLDTQEYFSSSQKSSTQTMEESTFSNTRTSIKTDTIFDNKSQNNNGHKKTNNSHRPKRFK